MSDNDIRCEGTIPWFLIPRLGWLTQRRFTYGPPIKIGLTRRQLLLTHPDDVFHVLVINASNYSKSRELTESRARSRVGGGLLGRRGTAHHDRRRSLQPLYSQRGVQAYVNLIEEQCQRLIDGWRVGESRDLALEMGRLTRRILFAALFGELTERQIAVLENAVDHRRRHTEHVYFSRIPNFSRWPTLSRRRDRQAQAVFAEFVQQGLRSAATGAGSGLLLTAMSTIRLPDGRQLTEADIIDEVLSLMSTGHETITEWLTWCWVLVTKHPDFESRWRAEIGTLGPYPEWYGAECEAAPLTYGLLEESLRLYPPTWLFARIAIHDDQLPGGTLVRAGQQLLLCQYLMHRNPQAFAEPEEFIPARFQALNWGLQAGRNFFPFGSGAHRCIGDKFARMETLVVLLTIARAFSFEAVRSSEVIPSPGLTLGVRGGFRVRLR